MDLIILRKCKLSATLSIFFLIDLTTNWPSRLQCSSSSLLRSCWCMGCTSLPWYCSAAVSPSLCCIRGMLRELPAPVCCCEECCKGCCEGWGCRSLRLLLLELPLLPARRAGTWGSVCLTGSLKKANPLYTNVTSYGRVSSKVLEPG